MSGAQKIAAFCMQCRSRCGCVAVGEDGRLLGIEPLLDHPTGQALCPKGRAAPELVYHPERVTRPLRRTQPKGAPAIPAGSRLAGTRRWPKSLRGDEWMLVAIPRLVERTLPEAGGLAFRPDVWRAPRSGSSVTSRNQCTMFFAVAAWSCPLDPVSTVSGANSRPRSSRPFRQARRLLMTHLASASRDA